MLISNRDEAVNKVAVDIKKNLVISKSLSCIFVEIIALKNGAGASFKGAEKLLIFSLSFISYSLLSFLIGDEYVMSYFSLFVAFPSV